MLCKLEMLNEFTRKIQRKSPRLLNTIKMVLVYCSPSQKFLEVQCVLQWRHLYPLSQTNLPSLLQDCMKYCSIHYGVTWFSYSYILISLKCLLKIAKEVNFQNFPWIDNFSVCHSIRMFLFVTSRNIFLLLIKETTLLSLLQQTCKTVDCVF